MRIIKSLFILVFIAVSLVGYSQDYNSSNVHYYIPVGYSIEDIGVAQHPYASASILDIKVIIIRGNSIYSTLVGRYASSILRNRQKYIDAIERNIRSLSLHKYDYDSNLSTSKFKVYTRNVPASMWGPGMTDHYAVQRDFKQLIYWEDGYEDKKQLYYEIDIEDVLPQDVNLDFLE